MASTDYAACEGRTVDDHHCVIAEFCYRHTLHQESESERQPYLLPTATDAAETA